MKGANPLTETTASSSGEVERDFPLPHGRGDHANHRSPAPDQRDKPKGMRSRDICDTYYGHIDQIRVKARDFR
jgi:error-prone DNA polymerase